MSKLKTLYKKLRESYIFSKLAAEIVRVRYNHLIKVLEETTTKVKSLERYIDTVKNTAGVDSRRQVIDEIRTLQSLAQGKASLVICRNILSSVDINQVIDLDKLDGSKRKAFVSQISSVHIVRELHHVIDSLIKKQTEYAMLNAQSQDQVMFARGTVNGLYLLKESIESMHAEHVGNSRPDEEVDPYSPV